MSPIGVYVLRRTAPWSWLRQTEKFTPQSVAELVAAIGAAPPYPVIAAAGGINPDNAGAYAGAGAVVLVTSWPYTARPEDVAIKLVPE